MRDRSGKQREVRLKTITRVRNYMDWAKTEGNKAREHEGTEVNMDGAAKKENHKESLTSVIHIEEGR